MTEHFAMFDGAVWVQLWQVTALVIVVGIVSRFACRHRPHLAYLLWMVVLAKCLTPPILSSEWSVFSQLQQQLSFEPTRIATLPDVEAKPLVIVARTNETASLANELEATKLTVLPSQPTASEFPPIDVEDRSSRATAIPDSQHTASASVGNSASVFDLLPTEWTLANWLSRGWLIGVIAYLLYFGFRRFQCAAVLRRSQLETSNELASLCESVRKRMKLKRPVRIHVTSRGIGPAVFGLLRPVILLPQHLLESRDDAQIETILAHELQHIKRGDTLVAWFQIMVQALWWFNPLIWWMNRQIVRERERCCDDEVVSGIDGDPELYAQTLLDVLRSTHEARSVPGVPGIRPVDLTKKRLEHIMSDRRRFAQTPKSYWLLLIVLLAILIPGAAVSLSNDKPAKSDPIVLRLDSKGKVYVLGRKVAVTEIKPILEQLIKLVAITDADGNQTPPTVSIQAAADANPAHVKKLIEVC